MEKQHHPSYFASPCFFVSLFGLRSNRRFPARLRPRRCLLVCPRSGWRRRRSSLLLNPPPPRDATTGRGLTVTGALFLLFRPSLCRRCFFFFFWKRKKTATSRTFNLFLSHPKLNNKWSRLFFPPYVWFVAQVLPSDPQPEVLQLFLNKVEMDYNTLRLSFSSQVEMWASLRCMLTLKVQVYDSLLHVCHVYLILWDPTGHETRQNI